MRKVYKYTLKKTTEQDVIVPAGAVVLSVAEQWGEAVLYALVDPDAIRATQNLYLWHGARGACRKPKVHRHCKISQREFNVPRV